jgi:hypothetical protein
LGFTNFAKIRIAAVFCKIERSNVALNRSFWLNRQNEVGAQVATSHLSSAGHRFDPGRWLHVTIRSNLALKTLKNKFAKFLAKSCTIVPLARQTAKAWFDSQKKQQAGVV